MGKPLRLIALMTILALGCNRPKATLPEPTFQGKPRSEWMKLASDKDLKTVNQAFVAIQATGGPEGLAPAEHNAYDAWESAAKAVDDRAWAQVAEVKEKNRKTLEAMAAENERRSIASSQPTSKRSLFDFSK